MFVLWSELVELSCDCGCVVLCCVVLCCVELFVMVFDSSIYTTFHHASFPHSTRTYVYMPDLLLVIPHSPRMYSILFYSLLFYWMHAESNVISCDKSRKKGQASIIE